jgi:hypothetical protein
MNHVIWDNVFGDIRGRFPDGTYIHTSNLSLNKDRCKEEDFLNALAQVQTRNSVYKLGARKRD